MTLIARSRTGASAVASTTNSRLSTSVPRTMFNHNTAYIPRSLAVLKLLALLVAGVGAGGTTAVTHAQAAEKVVAVVNGRRITQEDVDNSVVAQLLPLEQQIYAIRKAALENLIFRVLLEGEAKKRGVSVEELRRQLTDVKVEVLPSQVEKAYIENANAFGTMSPDEAKEKLRLDLENQGRLRNYHETLLRLREKSEIDFLLEEPKPLSVAVSDTAPSIGAKNAAVTIVEFSDFQCPYCKGAQNTLKELLRDYGKDVRLVFRHLPLDIHAQAFASAQAAFCAGEQGFFWQYHDALFASVSFSPETHNRLASSLGLNVIKFESCLRSEKSRVAVLADMQEAKRLGVDGTPTFIVNGKLIRGTPGLKDFRSIIERELNSAHPASNSR